ncbi:MAG: response regulator [Myxococcota bacterium]
MAKRSSFRVLVVDDDQDMCLFLKDFLSSEGFRVSTVTSPEEAVPEIRDGKYQIVLLDIRMPGRDGISLLREIRALDSDLCVIVMTAYPSVETAVETMKADAFDYLPKPFEPEDLRAALARAVQEKGLFVDAGTRLNQLIGTKLRSLRSERKLTLRQVANKTRLSVSLISQIELGRSAASVSTLHKLATALRVKIAHLFEGV